MDNNRRTHQLTLPPANTSLAHEDRLRALLKKTLQDAATLGLGLGLSVSVSACGGGEPLPDRKVSAVCESAAPDLGCKPELAVPDFARLNPKTPVSHWVMGHGRSIDKQHGVTCGQTANSADCQAQIDAAIAAGVRPPSGNCEAFEACDPGEQFILARGANGITILKTQDELHRFLSPIENAAEAAAVALHFSGSNFNCEDKRSGISCEGDAFTVVATQDNCGGTIYLRQSVVPVDGPTVTTTTLESKPSNCAIGRIPDGCDTQIRGAVSWGSLADFWSDCAALEAASVPAFYLLAEDLRALGAPDELVAQAMTSAEDEIRHAKAVFALAARAGAGSVDVKVPARSPKSLFEMAHENAVEGCVRETFGAFIGAYQANAAQDPTARAVLVQIAEDEMKHAALSHAIAAWAEPLLTDAQRQQISEDRKQMVVQLRKKAEAQHAADVYAQAGYPSTEAAACILNHLEETLWA